jgi:hypothetical protein
MTQEVTAMKRYQSIGLGLAVAAMVLFVAVTMAALAQTPAPPPTNAPSDTTDVTVLIGLIAVLLVLGTGVRLYDLQRRREQRAMELQARLSDAFLLASVSGVAITPTVHAPFWSRDPLVIDIAGFVATPAMRDAVIQFVRRETLGGSQELHIEDRILVNPRMARRLTPYCVRAARA